MKVFILLLFLTSSIFISAVVGEVYFEEKFDDGDGWESRWVQSTAKGDDAGKFLLKGGKFNGDPEGKNRGIQTSQDAKFYGISSKMSKAISNKDKDLVLQFSVKHEQNIDCGGGYVKLFPSDLDQTDMHGDSAYAIMFGPDICGPGTKRVHAIFSYKGKNLLLKKEVRCKDDVFTHLYTLVVRPDNTYEILIDTEKVESGDLEEDWDFLPPKTIKDPEASKPEDWDEREKVDDPTDSKPEDWDQAEHVADPDATKPEDWDDEMDGEWEPPMVDNPDFKGDWSPKKMDNPDYKGKWVHPSVDNPDYDGEEVTVIGKYSDIGVIGFDLWQVKSGTIFDNILITDDIEHAKKVGKELLSLKEVEKKMKDEEDEEERKKMEAEGKLQDEEEEDEDEDDEDMDDLDEEMKEELDEDDDEEMIPEAERDEL